MKQNRYDPVRYLQSNLIEFGVHNKLDKTNENTPQANTHTYTLLYIFWHHIFNLKQKQRTSLLSRRSSITVIICTFFPSTVFIYFCSHFNSVYSNEQIIPTADDTQTHFNQKITRA